MKSLFRAARPVLRSRFSLAAAIACSFLASALWGANIGTLYPFVEIVFRGESLQASMTRKIEEARQEADRRAAAIADLQAELPAADRDRRLAIERELEVQRSHHNAEMRAITTVQRNRKYVDKIFPEDPFQTLVLVVAALVCMTLLKNGLLVANEVLVTWISQKGICEVQNEFYRRTLQLDLNTFGDDRASVLMSCLTHRIQAVGGALHVLFGQAIREPLKLAACLVGAAIVSWRLLLVSLILAPLGIFLLHGLTSLIRRGSRQDMDLVSETYQRLSETLFGIATVKAFGGELHEQEKFRKTTHRLLMRRRRNAMLLALASPVSEMMAIGIVAIAMLASSYLVLNREQHLFGIRMCNEPLSPAALMVFFGMLAGIADPARKLSRIYGQLFFGGVAASQVFRMMDRQPRVQDAPDVTIMPAQFHELHLDNVAYAYEKEKPVLQDIQLQIRAGQKLAIVGANGCGKSTLVKLLPRFFDPARGTVRWNGIDLRKLPIADLRRQISMVTQETWLFDDTVLNNIRYGHQDAEPAQVVRAAEAAGAHEMIQGLEQGYDTCVGERGCQLSGGQRQRIALARALLRDPAILVLDEATSDIDAEAEQLIHEELERFARGRTLIMITHRVSSLVLADQVVVMERGRIVDVGTHDQLLSRCDVYRRWQAAQWRHAA